MGSYDGAEVCELVGLFLLNDLSNLIGKNNVGLYRDDGLAVVDNASGPQMDKIRKQMHDIFKKNDLSITTEINLSTTDFGRIIQSIPEYIFSIYKARKQTSVHQFQIKPSTNHY